MEFSQVKTTETVTCIAGPAGDLELAIDAGHDPIASLLVCHPHPLGGGSMNNKVVTSLLRAGREQGLATVRFNFRGVGASQGLHDHGRGEQADLRCVLSHMQSLGLPLSLWLAGFSFGSFIAASVAATTLVPWRLQGLLLVAPPVHNYPFAALALPTPTWVVQGDSDELVAVDEVRAWVAQTPAVQRLDVVPACGHFFHGHLEQLRSFMTAAVHELLPQVDRGGDVS